MRWSHSTNLGKSYPEITFPVKNVLVYLVKIKNYKGECKDLSRNLNWHKLLIFLGTLSNVIFQACSIKWQPSDEYWRSSFANLLAFYLNFLSQHFTHACRHMLTLFVDSQLSNVQLLCPLSNRILFESHTQVFLGVHKNYRYHCWCLASVLKYAVNVFLRFP